MATDFIVDLILSGHDVFLLEDEKTKGWGNSKAGDCYGHGDGGRFGLGYGYGMSSGAGFMSKEGNGWGNDQGDGDGSGWGDGYGPGWGRTNSKSEGEKKDKYGYRLPA